MLNQTILEETANAIDNKHSYNIIINNRLRRYAATANTWHYMMSGHRVITVSGRYLDHADETSIIKTLVHEIAHFKEVEKYRKSYLRNKHTPLGSKNLRDVNALYRMRHRRPHNASFWRLLAKMTDEVELLYGEPLGRLTCNFCKFAGQRIKHS